MTWTLTHPARPWTLNDARGKSNRWTEHARTSEWRGVFHLLALEAKVPWLDACTIVVDQECRTARLPDVAACAPAAKAAVDGLVDAGVLTDDSPQYLRRVTFNAPHKTGRDALTLTILEATP